ncbi:MAG: BPL-N domain-containing protein [Actinomycetes bacterium]
MSPGPLAVVYRGEASLPGCPEAAARALASSPYRFRIQYARPTESSLRGAALYCQPGGGDLGPAWRRLRKDARVVRDFVQAGGRYLGFCLGGYLAGDDPGFGLLAGATDRYVGTPGCEVSGEGSQIVDVTWAGRRRSVYFQDGCYFVAGPSTEVVATYANGLPAAVVSACGQGWVGVTGPHPEASDDWFRDEDLPPLAVPTTDLAHDLIRRVMER